MKVLQKNYFCKERYVSNDKARTLDYSESDTYWTQERIDASSSRQYQYYVYSLAVKIARQRRFTSVMDVGSGPGIKAKNFFSGDFKNIILIDQPNTEKKVKEILPKANFVAANLENCNIDLDEMVELIVCADVLEHLFNPIPCIKFVLDHLTSDGVAIFSTPERDILRGPNCLNSPHPSHVREWNTKEFNELLSYSGFDVVQQKCMPMEKLTGLDFLLKPFFCRMFRQPKWSSCQTAVCTKSATLT